MSLLKKIIIENHIYKLAIKLSKANLFRTRIRIMMIIDTVESAIGNSINYDHLQELKSFDKS